MSADQGDGGGRQPALGEPTDLSPGPTPLPRPDGRPGLPVDPALVTGRAPEHDPERIPELHEVDCPPDLRERIEELMSRYPDRHSASIPALWEVQRRYGWCTPDGVRQAAAVMRVTPAYLESVASFYDLLRTEPFGNHSVLVCTNISCWMRGGDELLGAFCEAAGCDAAQAAHGGASSADGEMFVSGFECLGACDLAPMASVDERYFGPLTGEDAATIVGQLRAGEEVLPERSLARRPLAGGPDGEPDPRVKDAKGPNR